MEVSFSSYQDFVFFSNHERWQPKGGIAMEFLEFMGIEDRIPPNQGENANKPNKMSHKITPKY